MLDTTERKNKLLSDVDLSTPTHGHTMMTHLDDDADNDDELDW